MSGKLTALVAGYLEILQRLYSGGGYKQNDLRVAANAQKPKNPGFFEWPEIYSGHFPGFSGFFQNIPDTTAKSSLPRFPGISALGYLPVH